MDFKTFLEHFDTIAQAPNGIAKLRSLILDLAVRGKLVPQNPDDEPALDLLKKLKLEKERLLQEKKFLKSEKIAPITLEDLPHAIPKEWVLTRIGVVCGSIVPNRDKPKSFSGGFPWITLSNFSDINIKLLNNHSGLGLSQEEITKFNARIIPSRSVLMSCVGRFGLVAVVEKDVVANQQIHGFVVPSFLCPEYVAYVIKAHTKFLESSATSTTVAYLNKTRCESIPFPLPPLAEQKRIVEKVDELMALCDRLQQSQETRDNLRQKLRASAIDSLMNAETDEELKQSWAIVRDNWQTLSQKPEDVSDLRRSVLQLAVRGKLVPQNSNDKPATHLLKQIEVEKQQLIEEGKIKRCKPLPEIQPEELPYQLPKGWEWVRLGYIGEFINGDRGKNYPNRDEYVNEGIPWINTGHIEPDGSLTQTEMNFISREKFNSLNSGKIEPGDLVYCLRGATFGKTAIVDPYKEGAIASSLMIIRPFVPCSNRYIYRYLVSPVGRNQIYRFDNGSAQPNLSANSVQLYVFPLPPLNEQKRIVAKVDELMQMCDQLEESLRQSQQQAEALAASAISHLTI